MTEEDLAFKQGKSGFVAIIGRPNVGKSTFINQVLGYHLTAVSERPNTTRKKWIGILSDEQSQIIFVDTPGVHSSKNKMQEAMATSVRSCVDGNDLALCLCDATRKFGNEDRQVAELARNCNRPILLGINKVDAADPSLIRAIRQDYLAIIGEVPWFEISSKTGEGINSLLDCIRNLLPEGAFLYPDDQLTDVPERDVAEEIIREAANELVFKEVPQCLTVRVDAWNESEKKIRIAATLFVERESQKAIVIGEKGSVANGIIKNAREKLRRGLGKFVEIKLSIKAAPDWQNQLSFLRDNRVVDNDR